MVKVDITQQDSQPRINETGRLVYSELSDTLFIKTIRAGVKAIGGSETDPIFTAWLAGPPNITEFTNNAGYLSIVSVDGVTITGDGTPGNPLVAASGAGDMTKAVYDPTNILADAFDYNNFYNTPTIPSVTPAALTKTDDTNVTLTLGGSPSTALLQGVSLTLGWTGTLADSRIASAATWNGKQNAITTGTTAQYLRGDLSLATFPTNVSSFTNDSGYITSAALSPYLLKAGGTMTGAFIESVSTLTDAANISVDATLGNIFTVTLGGNRTLSNPTGAVNGQRLTFRVRQDGSGNRNLAFDTKFRFGTDLTSITLSTGANKTDYIGVIYHGVDDKFDIVAIMKGF